MFNKNENVNGKQKKNIQHFFIFFFSFLSWKKENITEKVKREETTRYMLGTADVSVVVEISFTKLLAVDDYL